MKLAWIFALLCTPAVAGGWATKSANAPDNVYIYWDGVNINYQCQAYLAYFDTEGNSVFYADECRETSSDSGIWPHFVPAPIRVSMDFADRLTTQIGADSRILRDCLFVAHAQNPDRTTSTVIDCR